MPSGRMPGGSAALSNAERQARPRAKMMALQPPLAIKRSMLGARRCRSKRWNDALAEMVAVQSECDAWFDALSESLRDSANGEQASRPCRPDHPSLTVVHPMVGETDQASHTEIQTLPPATPQAMTTPLKPPTPTTHRAMHPPY